MLQNNYLGGFQTPDQRSEQGLIQLVQDRRRASMDWVREPYSKTDQWYQAFLGAYTGRVAPHLNNITIPLIFATIMADVARKANSIFGPWPIITFEGFPDGARDIAHKNELLVSLQLKEAQSFRKGVDFFIQADLNGTAVAEVGWSHIERLRQFRQRVQDQVIEIKAPVVEFDGPNWRPLDLLNFLPQAYKTRIPDMDYYQIRYWEDFDNILELNSGDGLKGFDPAALKRLAETAMPTPSSQDEFMGMRRMQGWSDFLGNTSRTKGAKPVEIWEMRGLVPIEFAPDGIRNRVITVGNGRVVLRNDPDKLLLSRHRVVSYSPCPDPYHFVGIGKAQIAEPLQNAAGRLANQKLDIMDLFGKPQFLAVAGSMASNNLTAKPGRVHQVLAKGRPLSEVIQALVPNMQGVATTFQEFAFLDALIQKGTGIDESAVMGFGGGATSHTTASEFQGRQEAAMTRLALESMLASAEFLEPMAEIMRDMNKTMLSLPKQFSMIGSRATLNPVTGLPMPQEEGMFIDPDELNHSWTAKAFGPMFMLTKSVQRQDAVQLAQLFMANPVWVQATNWINFARKIYSLYDWDSEEMLVQQVPQITQLANQLGSSPEQAIQQSMNPVAAFAGPAPGGM